jgi:hypothetical protein
MVGICPKCRQKYPDVGHVALHACFEEGNVDNGLRESLGLRDLRLGLRFWLCFVHFSIQDGSTKHPNSI